MAISGLFFLLTRLFQLTTLIPIVGMLSYFVHIYVKANALTPNYILIMFIVSVLAAAWVLATTVLYWTARYSAHVVAAFDLAFVGAFIAAVYFLRGPGTTNCNHLDFYAGGGSAGVSYSGNKDCTMLKACFALGIIETILFFEYHSFWLSWSHAITANPWSSAVLITLRAIRTAAAAQAVVAMNTAVAVAVDRDRRRGAAIPGGRTTFSLSTKSSEVEQCGNALFVYTSVASNSF